MTPLMTASEVARYARVTPCAVRQWANTGKLPCERTGIGHGIRLFRRQDVEAFVWARWASGTLRAKEPTDLPCHSPKR